VDIAEAIGLSSSHTPVPAAGHQEGSTSLKILRNSDQPSTRGPAEYFTGSVRIDSQFAAPDPARAAAAVVTFEPGSRTAWHTHPLGQRLLIVSGEGWVQKEGEAKQFVQAGDTVWFEPDEKHWHGATDRKAMTHVAIQEARDGSPVNWMEQVSDEDYLG
jgi:quercetin dioxygenase-like cupin family protein